MDSKNQTEEKNTSIEWYEDHEPEIDYNELNKKANIIRYTNAV